MFSLVYCMFSFDRVIKIWCQKMRWQPKLVYIIQCLCLYVHACISILSLINQFYGLLKSSRCITISVVIRPHLFLCSVFPGIWSINNYSLFNSTNSFVLRQKIVGIRPLEDQKWFQRRRFLEIHQLETRIACGSHVC